MPTMVIDTQTPCRPRTLQSYSRLHDRRLPRGVCRTGVGITYHGRWWKGLFTACGRDLTEPLGKEAPPRCSTWYANERGALSNLRLRLRELRPLTRRPYRYLGVPWTRPPLQALSPQNFSLRGRAKQRNVNSGDIWLSSK